MATGNNLCAGWHGSLSAGEGTGATPCEVGVQAHESEVFDVRRIVEEFTLICVQTVATLSRREVSYKCGVMPSSAPGVSRQHPWEQPAAKRKRQKAPKTSRTFTVWRDNETRILGGRPTSQRAIHGRIGGRVTGENIMAQSATPRAQILLCQRFQLLERQIVLDERDALIVSIAGWSVLRRVPDRRPFFGSGLPVSRRISAGVTFAFSSATFASFFWCSFEEAGDGLCCRTFDLAGTDLFLDFRRGFDGQSTLDP